MNNFCLNISNQTASTVLFEGQKMQQWWNDYDGKITIDPTETSPNAI